MSDSPKTTGSSYKKRKKIDEDAMVFEASCDDDDTFESPRARRNVSSTTTRKDKYKNIDSGITPFSKGKHGHNSNISAEDVIELTQKAYYNVPIIRNTIELMVEFSVNEIYYRGGTKKSQEFFENFFQEVRPIWEIQDQFFREYYRSGNIFIYPLEGEYSFEAISNISKHFGGSLKSKIVLPVSYFFLNPLDVRFSSGSTFVSGTYYKELNDYEVSALRSPKTENDKMIFDNLPEEDQKAIKSKNTISNVLIKLNPATVYSIFYKKQDYEPFAVPMVWGVLSDVSWKEEMKSIDLAISRTIQQSVLMVTSGDEKNGVNKKNLLALTKMFQNPTVSRTIIADYTTKAQFVIPDISDLLSPEKYAIVNEDIRAGLHNILVDNNERFANKSVSAELFLEKLKQSRQCFLNKFLIPEIKRISRILGFKSYPVPFFKEFDLRNDVDYCRLFIRMAEVGILTPEESIKAFETGILPTPEESVAAQKKLAEHRKEDLFMPLSAINKQQPDNENKKENGRPKGSYSPQTTKKISPIGASVDGKPKVSLSKMTESAKKLSNLDSFVSQNIKQFKNLNKPAVRDFIVESIAASEPIDSWVKEESFKKHLESFQSPSAIIQNDQFQTINEIATKNKLDIRSAIILFHATNE